MDGIVRWVRPQPNPPRAQATRVLWTTEETGVQAQADERDRTLARSVGSTPETCLFRDMYLLPKRLSMGK